MNDSLDENLSPVPPSISPENAPETRSPLSIILISIGFFMVGNLVTGLVSLALAKQHGVEFNEFLTSLDTNSPIEDRNSIRSVLFMNHVFSFILPAIFTTMIVYKNMAVKYLKLDKMPNLTQVGLAFLLLVVSVPLVQYSYLLNKMVHLPKWMLNLEQDTSKMLEAIIKKEYWYESVLNVLLIGVVPAIGEEMMFRGILQQQLGRIFRNEHVMVWVSAAIFSAIHMQFEGFLARMILGALLGYLFVWTRNLWVPMIVHLLNNSLQIIYVYAANLTPSEMEKMGNEDKMTWWMALVSLGFVVFVARLIKSNAANVARP
jgi:uncharacterized protein